MILFRSEPSDEGKIAQMNSYSDTIVFINIADAAVYLLQWCYNIPATVHTPVLSSRFRYDGCYVTLWYCSPVALQHDVGGYISVEKGGQYWSGLKRMRRSKSARNRFVFSTGLTPCTRKRDSLGRTRGPHATSRAWKLAPLACAIPSWWTNCPTLSPVLFIQEHVYDLVVGTRLDDRTTNASSVREYLILLTKTRLSRQSFVFIRYDQNAIDNQKSGGREEGEHKWGQNSKLCIGNDRVTSIGGQIKWSKVTSIWKRR